ncbi:ubiquinol-cytochrome c reductase iron-sulfur subunit [Massilia sp. TWR1-2-2]|uniref:ubiquinol-cytochrome c reductase iron-sulfur subunit n=1 Tax=Massilia sp. TWR1-2-2 TaxID=2804584 RepID=UPI003CF7F254
MDQTLPPNPRRHFLGVVTSAVGTVGLVAVAIPFVTTMTPSERARAAGGPVDVPLASVPPGTIATVEWRGRPVWILHRTPAMLAALGGHDAELVDPASQQDQQPFYARNATRATRPEFFIATAVCTHLGCIPAFRPEVAPPDLGPRWPGGFFCPCHGSTFDLAGRVFRNVPAPRNLEIPPYSFAGDSVVVGVEPLEANT